MKQKKNVWITCYKKGLFYSSVTIYEYDACKVIFPVFIINNYY